MSSPTIKAEREFNELNLTGAHRNDNTNATSNAARTKQRVLKRYIWRPTSDAKSRCKYDG